MDIFIKHPVVYIDTTDHCSTQAGLVSQQKERQDSQIQTEYKEAAPDVPKAADTCSTTAEDFQVQTEANNFLAHAIMI